MISSQFSITRINNACVLIHLGGHYILTDPYFVNVPLIGVTELAAISPAELPPLTAIIGCHNVIDHWQMKGFEDYPHNKDNVQVFVAMEEQANSARAAGFDNAQVLPWGSKQIIDEALSIESVKAQKMLKWTVNNYVIRIDGMAIFFGSEARDLPPLREYTAKHGPVDIALLPVNGVYLMSFYQLVMRGEEAVQATKILGAKILIAIHDAHKSIPFFLPVKSSGATAEAAAQHDNEVDVIRLPTGTEWPDTQTGDRNI